MQVMNAEKRDCVLQKPLNYSSTTRFLFPLISKV